jgi:hypothetical protein
LPSGSGCWSFGSVAIVASVRSTVDFAQHGERRRRWRCPGVGVLGRDPAGLAGEGQDAQVGVALAHAVGLALRVPAEVAAHAARGAVVDRHAVDRELVDVGHELRRELAESRRQQERREARRREVQALRRHVQRLGAADEAAARARERRHVDRADRRDLEAERAFVGCT